MSATYSKASDITVTDQFCGAGGSSLGAARHGVRIRLALNHWQRAIETHNTNFPDTDHDCTDVSAADPRRYYATDILITSPECTNHSLAQGQKRKHASQEDLFVPTTDDPSAERSRATMWDVVRFAEQWRYRMIITENVVDARTWVLYDAMMKLGYRKTELYFNSMFFWPTPQNRDRLYVVWTHKSAPTPDLTFTPPAYCNSCTQQVQAQQAWKNGKQAGKYDSNGKRGQYLYTCPHCRRRVEPYYFAALNAMDWSLPIERIGDRTRSLKPRTRERIARGLVRFGQEPIIVQVNSPSRLDSRVRSVRDPHFTQCSDAQFGVSRPPTAAVIPPALIVELTHSNDETGRVTDARTAPRVTQTHSESAALVMMPAPGVHALTAHGVIQHPAAPHSAAQCIVLKGSALVTLRDEAGGYVWSELDGTLHTQVATPQSCIVARSPHIMSYTSHMYPVTDATRTILTKDQSALLTLPPQVKLAVDDCYFRMLGTHEIGAAMAFDASYVVTGTKKEVVKQYGNAVTPPVMEWIIGRCVAALTGAGAA